MYKALFLSHGGGPLPLLGDAEHAGMIACLKDIVKRIPKPDAILIVSAHWETQVPTITASPTPGLIYDYYGFPEASYHIEYPCAGDSDLADEVYALLHGAGLNPEQDATRGLDHGVFVPLKIMYPAADIPCVQLSMLQSLDPAEHIKLGQALQPLQNKNVLLIGSGFSFHNMKAFFSEGTDETKALNQSFEGWLKDACTNADYSEQTRAQRLIDWISAPGARYCHPREEHLLPLHVCYGYAKSASTKCYSIEILNKQSSFYLWS